MSYTPKYFLQRVKRVNEIYREYSEKGVTNEFIYLNYIRDQFNISRTTFYDYLTIPYDKKIKAIKENEELQLKIKF